MHSEIRPWYQIAGWVWVGCSCSAIFSVLQSHIIRTMRFVYYMCLLFALVRYLLCKFISVLQLNATDKIVLCVFFTLFTCVKIVKVGISHQRENELVAYLYIQFNDILFFFEKIQPYPFSSILTLLYKGRKIYLKFDLIQKFRIFVTLRIEINIKI